MYYFDAAGSGRNGAREARGGCGEGKLTTVMRFVSLTPISTRAALSYKSIFVLNVAPASSRSRLISCKERTSSARGSRLKRSWLSTVE